MAGGEGRGRAPYLEGRTLKNHEGVEERILSEGLTTGLDLKRKDLTVVKGERAGIA